MEYVVSVLSAAFIRKGDSLSELLKYKTTYDTKSKLPTKEPQSVILVHSILLGYYAKLPSVS